MHINLFFISWVYLLLFLLKTHSAQNMATVKSREIYNSSLSTFEGLFYTYK